MTALTKTISEKCLPPSYLNALRSRHTKYERLIEAEMKRPMPDLLEVQRLKKYKLRVKERIENISL